MEGLVILAIVLSILVGLVLHEYGHMVRARKHGVTVTKYVIGMGKPIIKWHSKKHPETLYGIAPVPFGGYCEMDDEELNALPFLPYADILSAGVIRNFIVGLVLSAFGVALARHLINPIEIITHTFDVIVNSFSSLLSSLGLIFNPKEIAQYGGVASQFGATGTQITSLGLDTVRTFGITFLMAGFMNIVLGIFNLLPIPALDGGQITVRAICEFTKKFFNHEISNKTVSRINTAFFGLIMIYQGIILLMDFEPVRQFFLNL